MADPLRKTSIAPYRPPAAVSPEHTSQLVPRGIAELREVPDVPLPILDIVAQGSSLFVMSENWDANAREPASGAHTPFLYLQYEGRFDEELLSDGEGLTYEDYSKSGGKYPDFNAGRRVTLYEFTFDGEFKNRIDLPLIKLNEAGQDLIRSRVPGRPLIGPQYIHFHERFRVIGNSRIVRADYLFTRDGRRAAVWSNEDFFDAFSVPTELRVPYQTILKPQWMLNNQLVAIQPEGYQLSRHDLMNDLSYVGHLSSSEDWQEQYLHVVAITSIDTMIHNAQNPALVGNSRGFYHAQLRQDGITLYGAEFPVQSWFVDHKTYRLGWSTDVSDGQQIWFLVGTTLWCMAVAPTFEDPDVLDIPSPAEEIWANVRQLSDQWVTAFGTMFTECPRFFHGNTRWAYASNGTSYVEIRASKLFACGERVLIEWNVWYEHQVVYSLFIQYLIDDDGEMMSLGQLQPARKAAHSICRSMSSDAHQAAAPDEMREQQHGVKADDKCIDTVHRQLEGSRLISLGYLAGSEDTSPRWVLLTDVESGREDWFVPRVPASSVQLVTSSEI